MAVRRVPTGVKILIAAVIYILTFLLARPSDPVTETEKDFWLNVANLFGDPDVEGFIGIALLIGCAIITFIGYQITVRLIERKLKNDNASD